MTFIKFYIPVEETCVHHGVLVSMILESIAGYARVLVLCTSKCRVKSNGSPCLTLLPIFSFVPSFISVYLFKTFLFLPPLFLCNLGFSSLESD